MKEAIRLNMKIYKDSILSVYINLDSQKSKSDKTAHVLKSSGFSNILRLSATVGDPYYRGLCKSFYDALANFDGSPLAIFEDDIVPSPLTHLDINVPDDADVVFLGGYRGGVRKRIINESLTVYKSYRLGLAATRDKEYENVFRVTNMLSGHAVIFLNPNLVKEYRELLMKSYSADRATHADIMFAGHIMPKYNCYLFGPMFYQDTSDPEKGKQNMQSEANLLEYLEMLPW